MTGGMGTLGTLERQPYLQPILLGVVSNVGAAFFAIFARLPIHHLAPRVGLRTHSRVSDWLHGAYRASSTGVVFGLLTIRPTSVEPLLGGCVRLVDRLAVLSANWMFFYCE
jgi:hypothetical protein